MDNGLSVDPRARLCQAKFCNVFRFDGELTCAVESMPALRQILGSGHVVKFDEVIDALQELDGKADDIDRMEKPQLRRRGPDRGGNPEEGPVGSGYWY